MRRRIVAPGVSAAVLAAGAPVVCVSAETGAGLLDFGPPTPAVAAGAQDDPRTTPTEADAAARLGERSANRVFGEPDGGWWWGIDAGVVFSGDATDGAASLNFSTFLARGFEFRCGLRGWYFNQDGDDAGGFNPHFGFRWHFITEEISRAYTVYADLGIGLLAATDDVPEGGTTFNFTPRAGVGATIALGDSGARLDLGVGWHHISNASFDGTDDNPARDGVALWVGVIFPL